MNPWLVHDKCKSHFILPYRFNISIRFPLFRPSNEFNLFQITIRVTNTAIVGRSWFASGPRTPTRSRYFAKHYRPRTARCAVLINNYTGTASLPVFASGEWYLELAIRWYYSGLSIQYLLAGRRRVKRQFVPGAHACTRPRRHVSETTFRVNKVFRPSNRSVRVRANDKNIGSMIVIRYRSGFRPMIDRDWNRGADGSCVKFVSFVIEKRS